MGYLLKKRDLNRFLDKLIAKHLVVAPVKDHGLHRYEPVRSSNEVNLDFVNSIFPLKHFFLPYEEVLFTFKGKKIDARADAKPMIIFAMRPCDVNALLRMDKIFVDDCPDPYYAERRKKTTIIALACTRAGENCFCTSFGTHKLDKGFDLLFTEAGDSYFVEAGSEKGKALIDSKLFKESSGKEKPEISLQCAKSLTEAEIAKLKMSFYNEAWKQEAEKCLSCSACTMTCPTCGCFRILDIPGNNAEGGCRKRELTSCQLRNFTCVAGGFSFREERAMRLKQRIFHQLDYYKDRFGTHMCVGCGRCIANCPTGINMIKIIKAL